jgi:hypothetical protein
MKQIEARNLNFEHGKIGELGYSRTRASRKEATIPG